MAQKKRVAVMNFDYAPVHTNINSIFGRDQDVGKGIADLIVNQLVQDGTYTVIERKALDKIIAEQNFSNSDRADPTSAAKIGRILGVDAIIIGTVTQFGQDEKKRDVGGGLLGGLGSRYGLGGLGNVKNQEAHAVVTVTGRMVNTDTAEIIAVANGQGRSQRSATSLAGGGGYLGAAGGVLDMTSQDFSNSIMGEAVNQAVNSMARQLESRAAQLPGHKVVIEGLVADVSGDQLILNVGAKAGVKAGDHLLVVRQARAIKDPATGKVLRYVEDRLGDVVITEVEADSSTGRFTGSMTPKVGDTVKQ